MFENFLTIYTFKIFVEKMIEKIIQGLTHGEVYTILNETRRRAPYRRFLLALADGVLTKH